MRLIPLNIVPDGGPSDDVDGAENESNEPFKVILVNIREMPFPLSRAVFSSPQN